jgi:hypothetical protein
MNIYIISQSENTDWDTHDSAVVIAKSEQQARLIHPYGHVWSGGKKCWVYPETGEEAFNSTWTTPNYVKAQLVGIATKRIARAAETNPVILASFNAG